MHSNAVCSGLHGSSVPAGTFNACRLLFGRKNTLEEANQWRDQISEYVLYTEEKSLSKTKFVNVIVIEVSSPRT